MRKYRHQLTVKLDDETKRYLEEMYEESGLSRNEIVRRAIFLLYLLRQKSE